MWVAVREMLHVSEKETSMIMWFAVVDLGVLSFVVSMESRQRKKIAKEPSSSP